VYVKKMGINRGIGFGKTAPLEIGKHTNGFLDVLMVGERAEKNDV
jgi:hypothetical protein